MSITYISAIVAFLSFGLPALGVHVTDTTMLTQYVTTAVGIISLIGVLIGRYRAGGINAFGLRAN